METNHTSGEENILHIHFLYGSKPKKQFRHIEKKKLGGLWGGHVYLQLGEYVYGFNRSDESNLHIFPKKKFNAMFRRENLHEWKIDIKNHKLTSIEIPLDHENYTNLKKLFDHYNKNTPYDYAFFGMRCGASSHHILSYIGLFPPGKKVKSAIQIPYPRILRNRLLKMALENNFRVTHNEGGHTRIWEKGPKWKPVILNRETDQTGLLQRRTA